MSGDKELLGYLTNSNLICDPKVPNLDFYLSSVIERSLDFENE